MAFARLWLAARDLPVALAGETCAALAQRRGVVCRGRAATAPIAASIASSASTAAAATAPARRARVGRASAATAIASSMAPALQVQP